MLHTTKLYYNLAVCKPAEKSWFRTLKVFNSINFYIRD